LFAVEAEFIQSLNPNPCPGKPRKHGLWRSSDAKADAKMDTDTERVPKKKKMKKGAVLEFYPLKSQSQKDMDYEEHQYATQHHSQYAQQTAQKETDEKEKHVKFLDMANAAQDAPTPKKQEKKKEKKKKKTKKKKKKQEQETEHEETRAERPKKRKKQRE
jgi:hypothetical protein